MARRFAGAFGTDLGFVRVHPESEVATRFGALALTAGAHVAFAPGQFQPGTQDGARLIAHELAHVVQQAGGIVAQAGPLDRAGYEREADAAAEVAVTGGTVERLTAVGAGVQAWAPGGPVPARAVQHEDPKGDGGLLTLLLLLPMLQMAVSQALVDTILGEGGAVDAFQSVADQLAAADIAGLDADRVSELLSVCADVRYDLVPGEPANYVDAGRWLWAALALDDPSVAPMGLEVYLDYVARDVSGLLLAGSRDPELDLGEHGANLEGRFAALLENLRNPEGILALELEGAMDRLLELRVRFESATEPDERALAGAAIGELARQCLLLSREIAELRSAREDGEPPLELESADALMEHLTDVHDRVTALRSDALDEGATLSALGNGPELLSIHDVVLSEPLEGVLEVGQGALETQITPDEAFPVTTDDATLGFLREVTDRLEAERAQMEGLRAAIIPENPTYTLEEFAGVYQSWSALFSARARDEDPTFKDIDALYTALSGAFGMAGVEGGLGRGLLMEVLGRPLEDSLGGPSTDLVDDLARAAPVGRRAEVTGTAESPRYGFVAQVSGGPVRERTAEAERQSREDALRTGRSQQARRFERVIRASEEADELIEASGRPGKMKERMTGGPESLAAAQDNRLLPSHEADSILYLLDGGRRDDWAYLLSSPPADPRVEGPWIQEERRAPAALVEYLLAVRQYEDTAITPHHPTSGPDDVPVGDVAMIQGDLRTAEASSAARYLDGEASGFLPEDTAELRDAMNAHAERARRYQPFELIRAMEAYFDEWFARRTDTTWRLAAIVIIGVAEWGYDRLFLDTFSLANIGLMVGVMLAIVAVLWAISKLGPLGRALSAAIGEIFQRMGTSGDLATVSTLAFWVRAAGTADRFGRARTMAYFGESLASELADFTLGVMTDAGMQAFDVVRGIEDVRSINELDEVLGPVIHHPDNRDVFRRHLEDAAAPRRPRPDESMQPDPELDQLEALLRRLDGTSAPDLPLSRARGETPEDALARGAEAMTPDERAQLGLGSGSREDAQRRLLELTGHVDSDLLGPEQLDMELRFLGENADNPSVVRGEAPHREATIGEHTWRETPDGWCRHSTKVCAIAVPNSLANRAVMRHLTTARLAPFTPEQQGFIRRYRMGDGAQPGNPYSKLTNAELANAYDEGFTIDGVTGRLRDPDAGVYGPPSVRARYQDDGEAIESFEAFGHLSTADRAELDSVVARRRRALAESERTAGTEMEHRSRQQARDASEDLGELATRAYARRRLAGYTEVPMPGRGAGNFDQVYVDADGNYVLLEAKGGGSPLGTRYASDGETRVEQGTRDYVLAVIGDITRRDPDLGGRLRTALDDGRLDYRLVRQPVRPDGTPGRAEVYGFDISEETP